MVIVVSWVVILYNIHTLMENHSQIPFYARNDIVVVQHTKVYGTNTSGFIFSSFTIMVTVLFFIIIVRFA